MLGTESLGINAVADNGGTLVANPDVTLLSLSNQLTALQAQMNLLIELNGLDTDNPHTITPRRRYSNNIDITIKDDGNGNVIISS